MPTLSDHDNHSCIWYRFMEKLMATRTSLMTVTSNKAETPIKNWQSCTITMFSDKHCGKKTFHPGQSGMIWERHLWKWTEWNEWLVRIWSDSRLVWCIARARNLFLLGCFQAWTIHHPLRKQKSCIYLRFLNSSRLWGNGKGKLCAFFK